MKKQSKFLLLLLTIICFASVFAMSSSPALAETTYAPKISVYGEASKEITPDKATIYVTIENFSNTFETAKKLTLENYNKVLDQLLNIGVAKSDVNSTGFYDNSNCMNLKRGGSNAILDFCIKCNNLNDVNKIITTLESCENTKIRNINYSVSKNHSAYDEVLREAVNQATQKASKLLNKSNLNIIEIEEENTYYCDTLYKDYFSANHNNYLTEKICITAKVKVIFS